MLFLLHITLFLNQTYNEIQNFTIHLAGFTPHLRN